VRNFNNSLITLAMCTILHFTKKQVPLTLSAGSFVAMASSDKKGRDDGEQGWM